MFEKEGLKTRITSSDAGTLKALQSDLLMKEALLELLRLDSFEVGEFLDRTLEHAVSFTQSHMGFIFFYDEEQKLLNLHSWSHAALEECRIPDRTRIFQLEKLGLLGEVIRQGKPVILNDYSAAHEKKNGYPEGHVPIRNFISIPVFHQGKIVAV